MAWYTTKDGKHINTDWFDKENQITSNKSEADNRNLDDYAKAHGDIFLVKRLTEQFSSDEVKTMINKTEEVLQEFGIDNTVRESKIIYSLDADTSLEDCLATGAAYSTGVLAVNPNSRVLREDFSNIYHEMGHLIEYELLRRKMPNASSKTPNMANRLVHEAENYLKRVSPNASKYISNRGLQDNRELVAEAVRDYMMNKDKSKPMSKAVVRSMKKYVKNTRLGSGGN